MESRIESLWESLHSSSPQRYSYATEVASDLYSLCVEQITESELAYSSSVLFNPDNGILKFLHDVTTLEEFASCKEELLKLLSNFVKNLSRRVLSHIVPITDVCVFIFMREKSAKVKNATLNLLINTLELCGKTEYSHDLDIPKIADKFFQAALLPTKHSATIRGGIYHLLGVLCEWFPEHLVKISSRLIDIYMSNLKSEMTVKKTKKPELPIISGCLYGLTAYLNNFSQSASEGSVYAQDIYKYTRMAIDPLANLTRYEVPRAGLSLISRHAAQFREYLVKDSEHMYESLSSWSNHKNKECRVVAVNAIGSFFREVSTQISDPSISRELGISNYKFFMKCFRSLMNDPDINHRLLSIAVKGYGHFAKPCRLYGSMEDLHFMFGEMVQRSEQLFLASVDFTTSSSSVAFEERFLLPTFIEALANISKEIQNLPDVCLSSLQKLSVLLFHCYPFLSSHVRYQGSVSLLKLIMAVSSIPTSFKQFLSHIVYQGVIRSCSLPVVIEAVQGDDSAVVTAAPLADSNDKVMSYLDYVQLWIQLIDYKKLKGMGMDFDLELRQSIHQLVYSEFIQSLLNILRKLDFTTASTTEDGIMANEGEGGGGSGGGDPVITSDPVLGRQPAVPKDFQIFINLVELAKKVIPSVSLSLFTPWILTFSQEVVSLATRYPLVSGFYKLLTVCLSICNKTHFFDVHDLSGQGTGDDDVAMETEERTDRQSCYFLFSSFIKEVVVQMQQYKDDLLASCLHLILVLPKEMVVSDFKELIPAIKLALRIGMGYLPLAKSVMEALEKWTLYIVESDKMDTLQCLVNEILPLLADYLKATSVQLKEEEDGGRGKQYATKRYARMKMVEKWSEGLHQGSRDDITSVRRRILLLLGSLGGVVNESLSKVPSQHSLVSWDSDRRLGFAVPFSDLKPEIYLDPYLPTVCELALSSSDRQTKVAACEFLHAAMLFVIGKGTQQSVQKKNPMTKLYQKLIPVALQLACDVDRVAEQLFRPLVFQMIHWFTRNTQYESPDTVTLLEAILEGIEHPTNASLRDFSAQCIKEFLVWSIKQTSKKQQERSPMNTKSLLKRLYSMSGHPSTAKRLGAALAFNSIYTVLREEESLVDVFIIEMLVVMVNSLKLAHKDAQSIGTVDQCSLSLDHMSRIIKAKSSTCLSKANKNRRVPRGLKSADLSILTAWLLAQCGSIETEARKMCRKLLVQLAPPSSNVVNIRMWIRKTIESEGGNYFVTRFESHGHSGILKAPTLAPAPNINIAINWLQSLQAAVDNYRWLLKEQYVSPREIFSSTSSSNLFKSIDHFLKCIALVGIEGVVNSPEVAMATSIHERGEYQRNKWCTIELLLTFIELLLTKHTSETVSFEYVPDSLWSQELYTIVMDSLFYSSLVNTAPDDPSTAKRISEAAVSCLTAMCTSLPIDVKQNLIAYIASNINTGQTNNVINRLPVSYNESTTSSGILLFNRLVQGHIYLAESNKCLSDVLKSMGISEEESLAMRLYTNALTIIRGISSSPGDGTPGYYMPPLHKLTGELLLKLGLELSDSVEPFLLLVLSPAQSGAGASFAAQDGLLLYITYSGLINNKLLLHIKMAIDVLLKNAKTHPQQVSVILNLLLEYVQKDFKINNNNNNKETVETLCTELISHWQDLSLWWEDGSKDLKSAAVTLLQKIIALKPKLLLKSADVSKPLVDMYTAMIGDEKLELNFKAVMIDLLPSFLLLSSPEHQSQLKGSLNRLVSLQFPLTSSELPAGGPLLNEYTNIIEKLCNSLVASGSLVLLELIINIMCREVRHVCEEKIQTSLHQFISKLSEDGVDALKFVYEMFKNDKDFPVAAVKGIGERLCVPLFTECSSAVLLEFFVLKISDVMCIMEAKLARVTDPKLECQLVHKSCCFQFIEILYTRLPSSLISSMESTVNTAYCNGSPQTGKELTQAITKCCHGAKSEDLHGDRTHYETRRQYHCHAYNTLMSVISCTQSKPQFFVGFLFKEDVVKGQLLWDNIIDCEKKYEFQVDFEAPLKRRKQITSIRDDLKQSTAAGNSSGSPSSSPSTRPRYISSQYLSDSSLSTDVSQYDFTLPHHHQYGSVGGGASTESSSIDEDSGNSQEASSYVVSEEQLEEDDLNIHECMTPLMKLLDHMIINKITPAPSGDSPEMPPWMTPLHKRMTDSRTGRNIKLFIVRLITNRPKIFQPYAKHWLPVLTQFILSGDSTAGMGGAVGGGENGLDYFTVDAIATMLSWSSTAIIEDRFLGSQLLEYIMLRSNHKNRSILRNNLEIVRTMVELWKDKIDIPTRVLYDQFSNSDKSTVSNLSGIQLVGIAVANELNPYDTNTAGSLDQGLYYKIFVNNLTFKYKLIYAAAAEVLGMIMKRMAESYDPFLDRLEEMVGEQLFKLSQPLEKSEDKFITCLHKITLCYNKIVPRFVEKLLFLLPSLQGVFRSSCLEILDTQADVQPQFYLKLKDKGFHTMISHRDEATQTASLSIVQKLLVQLTNDQLSEIVPILIASFSKHGSIQCRIVLYNILMRVYNKLCTDDQSESDDSVKMIRSISRDQLLLGLGDESNEVKLKMYEYWNQESNLSSNTLDRLTQLLVTLYSKKTETQFLYHATNLLLELTSRSPDYNRVLFDTPLSECRFEDYKEIDLSWQQRHLQMTPLFAATQLSQTQSDTGSIGTGMLRATVQQSLAFTPTQGQESSYNWMTPSAQSVDYSVPSFTVGATPTSDSSLLFTRPTMRPPLKNPLRISAERLGKVGESEGGETKEEKRKQVLQLKKRALKDKEMVSSFFAMNEARKKMRREELKKQRRAARQSYVVMYRKYRMGELPDIQIKHSELIRPLQALAQNDSGLARLLFCSLFNSIFSQLDHLLTEEDAAATKGVIEGNINTILDCSTQYYPPFIGSLQDICYYENSLKIKPPSITTSSLASKQEFTGIMLLEKQLLLNVDSSKSAKRSRTNKSNEVTETWIELARLYKSLEDYDVLHGIFTNLDDTKDVTRKALEAEERGDYLTALNLYKKAIDFDWPQGESPPQVEEDLWEDSLLNAYSHLTKWKDLEKASTCNIGEETNSKLEQLWKDSYCQEHYLPFVLSSKLKLWCTDDSDHGLASFLDKSLSEEANRSVLESHYPQELTLSYVLRDDYDRAYYYLSLSLKAKQQIWSVQDGISSSTGAVSSTVQSLQRLTEMNEFITFMKSNDNFSSPGPVNNLLRKWRKRFPDPKLDPVPIWDDIITTRWMMLRKISTKLQDSVLSQQCEYLLDDDGSSCSVDSMMKNENINMFMRAADAARTQSNYPVAENYLKIVEKSILKDFPDNYFIQLRWLHSLIKVRLDRIHQDPSPTDMEAVISLTCQMDNFKGRLGGSGKGAISSKPFISQHHVLLGKLLNKMAEIFATPEDGMLALSALSNDGNTKLNSLIGGTPSTSTKAISEGLWIQALSSFNAGVRSGTTLNPLTKDPVPTVQSLEELFGFCDNALRQEDHDDEQSTGLDTKSFPSIIINHTLTAMSLGSSKARELFPRLLQLVEAHPDTMDLMINKSSTIPCWMFIGWINQMIALVDKPESRAVHDILIRIADTYPQSLYYAFRMSSSGYKFGHNNSEGKELFEKLKEKLQSQLMDEFIAALEQLNSPELAWKDWYDNELKPLVGSVTVPKRDKNAIKRVWEQMYSQLLETRSGLGDKSLYGGSPSLQKGARQKTFAQAYAKNIEDKFGKGGAKIISMSGTQLASAFNEVYNKMRESLNKFSSSALLKDYSPWLDTFRQEDYLQVIEVPGLYDGRSKPLPEYHAKITRFDAKVLILSSLRKPKRLTIIGDDTREYMFLVKGGEDLRLDQRIEQLFETMNKVLSDDPICSQRRLNLRTYSVIPVTPRVGLIEWVRNTMPLKDFIQLSDPEKKSLPAASKMNQKWLEQKFGGSNYVNWYYEMYKKLKADEVKKEYRRIVSAVPWDLLRRSLISLASTSESFLLLRCTFIQSLSVINICQYILGIGDRHLSNFMVDMETGQLVGIDFGHAFHSATQFLPLPELMPFRLTPQFVNLLLPHKVSGQLRSCMIHTLRALRHSPTLLLNTMDVFIKEPSLEWESNAKKQALAQKINTDDNTWYPKEKVNICRKKLLGFNSSHLMLIDLEHGFKNKPEFKYLKGILLGDSSTNLRARVGKRCDSVEDQVDCLIDHATDSNVLGRTYGGWEAWV
ncbi:PREDICTED: DNA-dependent protein kinase catalytic subunit [Amphimedon queenslandica]|uniref:DNA-dependent protein kinase catalytic subunit n=1 Tax=Amphimedon queenslandica TaxID=400682 RepID=A0A1X7VU01_AMPQE|nr:PREDICTED: DNA-dependent protein kinase catalytic subunit [Amphimedon queenslandica]|eukprot:XP_019852740.1 PREDICTED: DNA-dependent protein kinase catalytic subunit [Amphimedon queenslandica]